MAFVLPDGRSVVTEDQLNGKLVWPPRCDGPASERVCVCWCFCFFASARARAALPHFRAHNRGDVEEGSGFYAMFQPEGESQTLKEMDFEYMANGNHRSVPCRCPHIAHRSLPLPLALSLSLFRSVACPLPRFNLARSLLAPVQQRPATVHTSLAQHCLAHACACAVGMRRYAAFQELVKAMTVNKLVQVKMIFNPFLNYQDA
eukprot:678603-Rhodomonas_salina.1